MKNGLIGFSIHYLLKEVLESLWVSCSTTLNLLFKVKNNLLKFLEARYKGIEKLYVFSPQE